MKRILLYVPLSNKHRLPIMEQIARHEKSRGNFVSIYIETITPLCNIDNDVSFNVPAIISHLDWSIYNQVYVGFPGVFSGWRLLKGSKAAQEKYIRSREVGCRQLLEISHFDSVYLWNGNFSYQADFLEALKKHRTSINYVEVAWFDQGNTYYCDPEGVNASSKIARCAGEVGSEHNLLGKSFAESYRLKKLNGKSDIGAYILVPMQVESDSNIRLYSPYRSMAEFIEILSGWLPQDVDVVIRRHPKSSMREFPLPERFRWSREDNLFKDIAGARLVIGINSTVLLQSLALGKPVIAFGGGVWGGHTAIVSGNPQSKFQWPEYNEWETFNLLGYLLTFQRNYDQSIFVGSGWWGSVLSAVRILSRCLSLSLQNSGSLAKKKLLRAVVP